MTSGIGPKRVVYLWGAGATQGEISYLGAYAVNLLMRDSEQLGEGVATRILGQLGKRWASAFAADAGMDIEKLISLLDASSVHEYSRLADKIRKLYFADICKSLATAKILRNPQLAIALLSMHNNGSFLRHEVLSGIITTNHDGLLQRAAQQVMGQVNLGIPFESRDLTPNASQPPLLHLHGSFTWSFGLPLHVSLLTETSEYSREAVWIPPTILKETKTYPFNKLAGLAYELLSRNCDVLRVVGSALTQNDWNVLSMIFNAQRHSELTRGTPFSVELIVPHVAGMNITSDCSYLKYLRPIGYLTDGDFADLKEQESGYTQEMRNPLAYWLKQKSQFHLRRGDFGVQGIAPAILRMAGEIQ